MSNKIISNLSEVTNDWLTAVLTNSGALTHGTVTGFEVDTGRGNWSTNASLSLRYAAGSQSALPSRLFLKMVNTDLEDEFFGESEVTYYTRDYVGAQDVPLIRCYSAAYSEEQRRYYLLLDDVSQTHVQAATQAPTLEYGLALAEGMAALHAHWWGPQRLVVAGAAFHSPEHIQRFADLAKPGSDYIVDHFSSELQPHWPEVMHTFYAKHPAKMIARSQDANDQTLIHGDAGCYNILVPRTDVRPLYIIDRQPFNWSLTTWLGVYDLAFAIVLDWEVETRRNLEMQVLRHYHDQLMRRGINNYAWEQLWDDYRLCVAMGIYIATEWCRGPGGAQHKDIWLPMLQRALTACDDLMCSELW